MIINNNITTHNLTLTAEVRKTQDNRIYIYNTIKPKFVSCLLIIYQIQSIKPFINRTYYVVYILCIGIFYTIFFYYSLSKNKNKKYLHKKLYKLLPVGEVEAIRRLVLQKTHSFCMVSVYQVYKNIRITF